MVLIYILDKSVLENYHIAEAFKILNKSQCNILANLETTDFKHFRKRCIESVLATDMSNHSKVVTNTSSKINLLTKESKEFTVTNFLLENKDTNKFELQQDLINFVLHGIDIGHAAKPFELELKWADLVTKEFLNQGDTEKEMNLPVSFLCDRNTSNVPASQVGFISGIVLPTFQILVSFIPKSKIYVDLIEKAKTEWENLKNQKVI